MPQHNPRASLSTNTPTATTPDPRRRSRRVLANDKPFAEGKTTTVCMLVRWFLPEPVVYR